MEKREEKGQKSSPGDIFLVFSNITHFSNDILTNFGIYEYIFPKYI